MMHFALQTPKEEQVQTPKNEQLQTLKEAHGSMHGVPGTALLPRP